MSIDATHLNETPLTMQEIKTQCLGILGEIQRFFQDHDLRFWLAYGTLIGARRHGGFIPWDDDVDIMMPLEDYKRLCDLYHQGVRFKAPFELAFAGDDAHDHHITFAKVYDTTTRLESSFTRPGIGPRQGCWVDIFPLFGVDHMSSEDTAELERLRYKTELAFALPRKGFSLSSLRTRIAQWQATRHGIDAYLAEHEALLCRQSPFDGSTLCNDEYFIAPALESAWFEGKRTLPFETLELPVPTETERVLDVLYGAWRELPPESERIPHSNTIYWRA